MWLPWKRKNKPTGREIFKYRDGAGPRSIDPLVAWRRLNTDPELDMSIHFDMASIKVDEVGNIPRQKMAIEASQIIAAAARRVFELDDYSADQAKGVTEGEATNILYAFIEWMADQKKSTNPQPISS